MHQFILILLLNVFFFIFFLYGFVAKLRNTLTDHPYPEGQTLSFLRAQFELRLDFDFFAQERIQCNHCGRILVLSHHVKGINIF